MSEKNLLKWDAAHQGAAHGAPPVPKKEDENARSVGIPLLLVGVWRHRPTMVNPRPLVPGTSLKGEGGVAG